MNIIGRFKKTVSWGFNAVLGKAASVLYRPRKSPSPLADRLLTDVLRLAELPSPTEREELRANFVLDRLKSLGLDPRVDDLGNVLVRIHGAPDEGAAHEPPLLLFAELGTKRWHHAESLAHLDEQFARGAGLADALGPAALLSVAESCCGEDKRGRDLLLFFVARSMDDPETEVFSPMVADGVEKPAAALGIRGLRLGTIGVHTRGSYRLEIGVSAKQKDGSEPSSAVVNTLISLGRTLSGITWDGEGKTRFYIRRMEAKTLFGSTPAEGFIEVDLESSDGNLLEMAVNAVKATAEKPAASGATVRSGGEEVKTSVKTLSFIPSGGTAPEDDPLTETVKAVMKDLRIKVREDHNPDRSALFANRGIPALSLGLVLGEEGLDRDSVEIASIEKGRQLLENTIARLRAPQAAAPQGAALKSGGVKPIGAKP